MSATARSLSQAPEGFLAQREVVAVPEGLQLGGGDDSPVGVGPHPAALDRRARVCREGPVAGTGGEEGAQGGQVEVPRRGSSVTVVTLEKGPQVGGGEFRDRELGPEVGDEAGEHLAVDGAGAGR